MRWAAATTKRDSDDAREERFDSSRGEEDVVIRAAGEAAKAIATISPATRDRFFSFFPFIYFSMDNYQNMRLGTASKVGVATNKYRHMIIR